MDINNVAMFTGGLVVFFGLLIVLVLARPKKKQSPAEMAEESFDAEGVRQELEQATARFARDPLRPATATAVALKEQSSWPVAMTTAIKKVTGKPNRKTAWLIITCP